MTERKNINLTLSVPPETRNKLRELAFIQDKTHSAIVIELIDREHEKVKNASDSDAKKD
jgi:predicted DNA-binding protein